MSVYIAAAERPNRLAAPPFTEPLELPLEFANNRLSALHKQPLIEIERPIDIALDIGAA